MKSSKPNNINAKTKKHPCYSSEAGHKYARIHLPVAPACNISCNYCNRKFDCLNESRPGVTSEIATPLMAQKRFIQAKAQLPNLSVVGIAGPGDALANWKQTKATIQLVQQVDPDVIICLSTNGLKLPKHQEEMVEMGINHVTITINTLDKAVGSQIYDHVNYEGKRYSGQEGAEILLNNQLEGLSYLAGCGVLVKVNIVMIKGLNHLGIPELVRKVKKLGATMTNIMPLIPASGSKFASYPATDQGEVDAMRLACQGELKQMFHCRQCRADAVGMLGCDKPIKAFPLAKECSTLVAGK